MEISSILANSIWAGSFPYGFRLFGLHVLVELPLETFVIWLFLKKCLRFGRLFLWVLIANVASLVIGTSALAAFSVPMHDFMSTVAVWLAAFVMSWTIECFLLRWRLRKIPNGQIIRASFWGNVASYTIAALIFIAYIRGTQMPWPMIK